MAYHWSHDQHGAIMTEARAPPPITADKGKAGSFQPYELNPELATSKLVADIVSQNGPMMNVTKSYVVWNGIWEGLCDTVGESTYYDCSSRCRIYRNVGIITPHINGGREQSFWQHANKANVIVQGIQGMNNFEPEERQSLLSRFFGKFTGGNNNDTNANK